MLHVQLTKSKKVILKSDLASQIEESLLVKKRQVDLNIDPFHAPGHFLFDVFRGYGKGPETWNGLMGDMSSRVF